MTFAKIAKIRTTDRYLAEDLQIVPRAEAFIGKWHKLEAIAKEKFGEQWPNWVEIFEVPEKEYFRWLARRGGKTVTPRKRRSLRKSAKYPRFSRRTRSRKGKKRGPKPIKLYWWNIGTIAICARTIGQAGRILRRYDKTPLGTIRRHWKAGKPESAEYLPDDEGIFALLGSGWKRIL